MINLITQGESYLLLCPVCGDCWARIQGASPDHFWHRYITCEPHAFQGDRYTVSASLLEVEWADNELLDQLPPELVEREFKLHLGLREPQAFLKETL
jgi:hypothetical protein